MTSTGPLDAAGGGCDRGYGLTTCLWGTEPEPLVVELSDSLPTEGASILDAGCGEGRNAVHLARCGARVTALDVSALALRNAATNWPDENGVEWRQADLLTWPLSVAGYDAVVCDSVLHWLGDVEAAGRAVRRLKAATRPGGLHVVCTFNNRLLDYGGHATPPRCLLPHDDVLALYADWSVLRCHDDDIVSSHADVPEPHRHSVTRLLVRRPSDGGGR